MIKKVLFDGRGRKYYWKQGEFHSSLGTIKEVSNGRVTSNKNKDFFVTDANLIDNIEKLSRDAATMHFKEMGQILVYSGVDKDSNVLEAGSGSGFLTVNLARFVKKVHSYEIKKSSFDLVKKNLEKLGIKNVDLKNKDVYSGWAEKDLDLVVLDLSEPWKCLEHVNKSLKKGCYLIAYLPNLTQVNELIKESKKFDLYYEKTLELIQREWVISKLQLKPSHDVLGHTAFLVFIRKV